MIIAAVILCSVLPALYWDQGTSEGSDQSSPAGIAAVNKSTSAGAPENQVGSEVQKQAPVQNEVIQPLGSENTAQKTIYNDTQAGPDTQTTSAVKPVQAKADQPKPTVAECANASAQQAEMLGYINTARAEAGLAPLVLNDQINQCASLKSKDMAVNGYFSHYSPTYGSPFEMMTAMGIRYGTAGENIAKNFTVKGAFDAFMNSEGHRANILNGDFARVGLGFYRDSTYLYVTQMFTD